MTVSRREFLCGATLATIALARPGRVTLGASARNGAAILDLGDDCGLRESIAGYEKAFGAELCPASECSLLVVPGVSAISRATSRALSKLLDRGVTVILEHAVLTRYGSTWLTDFEISAGAPARLWPTRGIPYIEYSWPIVAHVRDFSWVLPIDAGEHEVIATVHRLPVAIAKKMGAGTLIFLGSPLGPVLLSGDREATQWIHVILSEAKDDRERPLDRKPTRPRMSVALF